MPLENIFEQLRHNIDRVWLATENNAMCLEINYNVCQTSTQLVTMSLLETVVHLDYKYYYNYRYR